MKKQHEMPHCGNMISEVVNKQDMSKARLAKRVGVHPSSFGQYAKSSSLQMRILWTLGLNFERNFIGEIADQFPFHHETTKEKELKTEIEKLESTIQELKQALERKNIEIEKKEVEIGVYRRIVERNRQA